MLKTIRLFLLLSVLCPLFLPAQNTVGLLSYNPSKTLDGYNLIYPHNQPNVYLLDNCGQVVHTWTDAAGSRPGNTAYLMPDGRLIKTKRPAAVAGNPIWTGGGGATVEIRDWNNNLEWTYTLNDSLHRLHHDICPTHKNTILMIAWERKTLDEMVAAGRNPATVPQGVIWPDYIIEVDIATKNIIWEWHTWDHLIQDFDATKANFGVVSDHPERVDINYVTNNGEPSWMHSNAIDYSAANDQILLSSPTFSEVWIIDHSTTTAQAASHSGGFSGRGGDLMYRWGNPLASKTGTAADQTLFFQHDPHWVEDFIDTFDTNYGKIEVFNNRAGTDYSTFNVFDPGFDMYEWKYPMPGGKWGPAGFTVARQHPVPTKMFSTGLSSVQYMPNGNYVICSGQYGYAFEITPANEIVWEYKVPLKNGAAAPQGTVLAQNDNQTFRLKRYPATYSAFAGKDLSQKGWIEVNPDSAFCDLLLPVYQPDKNTALFLSPNPATDQVTLQWDAAVQITVEVFDVVGRQVLAPTRLSGGRQYLDTSGWQTGLYYVRVNGRDTGKLMIQR
ncbi:MAG: aryl-sulfate sulfotransferase [Saprospiraceae bacterium]|nr:aryl-sulfate sulfotransferase [Saprospiraceae bacterium]